MTWKWTYNISTNLSCYQIYEYFEFSLKDGFNLFLVKQSDNVIRNSYEYRFGILIQSLDTK